MLSIYLRMGLLENVFLAQKNRHKVYLFKDKVCVISVLGSIQYMNHWNNIEDSPPVPE